MKISIDWLKGVISVVAIAAIAVRVVFPDIRIDSITLGLIVVAILPWLSELIESAKFPGGWEVKFRDVKSAGEQVTSDAPSVSDESETTSSPSFISVADTDANLALVGLRIEIEKRVRTIAEINDIPAVGRPLGGLLRELNRRELLPSNVASGLDELVRAGNNAAHGASVQPSVARWAIDAGPGILAALDALGRKP